MFSVKNILKKKEKPEYNSMLDMLLGHLFDEGEDYLDGNVTRDDMFRFVSFILVWYIRFICNRYDENGKDNWTERGITYPSIRGWANTEKQDREHVENYNKWLRKVLEDQGTTQTSTALASTCAAIQMCRTHANMWQYDYPVKNGMLMYAAYNVYVTWMFSGAKRKRGTVDPTTHEVEWKYDFVRWDEPNSQHLEIRKIQQDKSMMASVSWKAAKNEFYKWLTDIEIQKQGARILLVDNKEDAEAFHYPLYSNEDIAYLLNLLEEIILHIVLEIEDPDCTAKQIEQVWKNHLHDFAGTFKGIFNENGLLKKADGSGLAEPDIFKNDYKEAVDALPTYDELIESDFWKSSECKGNTILIKRYEEGTFTKWTPEEYRRIKMETEKLTRQGYLDMPQPQTVVIKKKHRKIL